MMKATCSIFVLFAIMIGSAFAPVRTLSAESSPNVATRRPRIGLALGGGGALGLSHIGVLKVLEEQRVPIDYIAGTSMGAIVAGCYASGMAPQEIQDFLEKLDWDEVMSDETPRRELYFRRKADDQRYLLEMGVGRHGVKMGTGIAAGQKFNNIMQYLTLRAVGVTDFDKLPIPYRAVATDLQSGTPYVISGGNLATAMRASMAVPGVFTAVEIDGRVLVDGGVVMNLPVDVVRSMGADIVIAVDVGSASDNVNPESLKTIGGILGRTYAIAQRPDQIRQFGEADVGIRPALAGFTAAEFHRVSELVPLGEKGAREKRDDLSRLGVDPETYTAFLSTQRHPNPESIRIGAITVTGNQRVSEDIIRGRIYTEPGIEFAPPSVNLDLMRVYGLGEFEQVLFRLTPDADGSSTLDYNVKEKAAGPLYFKYGLNLQSNMERDAEWAMLLNLTRMSLNRFGAEWRNELEIGSRQLLLSEFYQPLHYRGAFFMAPKVEFRSELQDIYQDGSRIAEYEVKTFQAQLDFGIQLRRFAELRIGPMWGSGKAEVETGASDLPELDEDYAGIKASLIVDRQDRTFFAREGYYIETTGDFAREAVGGDRDFDKVSGTLRYQKSIGDHTCTLGIKAGTSLGSDLPGYAQFTLGGPAGFAGIAENQLRGAYLGVGSLGYRYRLLKMPSALGRGVYTFIRGDIGNVWQDELATDDLRYGCLVGLGADSEIGPIMLSYGRSDEGFDAFYFSLGSGF
jgi:NTE family protein